MKTLILITTLATASIAHAQVLKIDGGANGMCLTGFAKNEPERFCIKPGEKTITKPKGPAGCIAPWMLEGNRCVAVLKVMPMRKPL